MRRIIFLDVDGVLNSGAWAMEMLERGVRVYRDNLLDARALRRLCRVVDATGADIVVSSSWRLDPEAFDRLTDWLRQYGMAVFDVTPYTGGERGDDLTAWLDEHPDVGRYVILDDDEDMGRHREHLIRTRFDDGLTDDEADRAIERLNYG